MSARWFIYHLLCFISRIKTSLCCFFSGANSDKGPVRPVSTALNSWLKNPPEKANECVSYLKYFTVCLHTLFIMPRVSYLV